MFRHSILNSNEFSRRASSITCDERQWPHVCPASWLNALLIPYKSIRTLLSIFSTIMYSRYIPLHNTSSSIQGTFHCKIDTAVSGHASRVINACCFSHLFSALSAVTQLQLMRCHVKPYLCTMVVGLNDKTTISSWDRHVSMVALRSFILRQS